jgi:hypothetical protein
MATRQQGVSLRQYAKHAGCSLTYIQRLLAQGKIKALPDGTLDQRLCDAYRAQNTCVGKGQRRRGLKDTTNASTASCSGCGEAYNIAGATAGDSPDPKRFCCRQCCNDVAAGLSRAAIRRRISRESEAS